jgi:hypothetical protein
LLPGPCAGDHNGRASPAVLIHLRLGCEPYDVQLFHRPSWLGLSKHLFLSVVLNVTLRSGDLKLVYLIAKRIFRKKTEAPPSIEDI